MRKTNNFVFIIVAIFLCGYTFVQNRGSEKMNKSGYFGTVRIITSYSYGLVLAVDGKGFPYGLDKDKIDEIIADKEKKKLMYHQKLFKVGKNLAVAFGGQLIRNYISIKLPEHLIEFFFKTYHINENHNLKINEVAQKLLNFLKNNYYSQPKEYWKNETSVFLAGYDENEPKVCIILVNSLNNPFGEFKNGIVCYEKFFNVLKHGPHWKEVEAKSKDISRRFYLVKTKTDKYESINRKDAINRDDAIYYSLTMIKECIKIESSNKENMEMVIDFPIHYCFIEKNKAIEIKEITN